MMDKLLVMTDLHISEPGDRIIGLNPSDQLETCLEAALTAHSDAKALVLLGDLTHHGTLTQYKELKRILDQVPIAVICMLGNHDRREAFLSVFPDTSLTDQGHVQSFFDTGAHRIITLDTLDGPPYPKGHHAGRLCPARLAWLDKVLVSRGDRKPLIFAHHPPFETGIVGMDRIKLSDGDALARRLATHGAHLFCGHLHRTASGTYLTLPWTMFKSTCHQGVLDFVSTDSSLSVDEPGAFGVIMLSPDGVVAHSEDVIKDRAFQRDAHSATPA